MNLENVVHFVHRFELEFLVGFASEVGEVGKGTKKNRETLPPAGNKVDSSIDVKNFHECGCKKFPLMP